MPLAEKLDRRFGWGRLPYCSGSPRSSACGGGCASATSMTPACRGLSQRRVRSARGGRTGISTTSREPGMGGRARLRAQRPGVAGPGSARGAAPARHQRRADHPHAVPARLAPERDRRGVAAVRGPRLGDARQGAADASGCWTRHAAAEGDRPPDAQPSSPTRRTGGTRRSSTARDPTTRRTCARTAASDVDDALLAANEAGDFNAPEANMWVGLALLTTLFAHEHNAIVRRLRAAYPSRAAPGCTRRRG